MLKESVHNSWKLKMSQYYHGKYTHQTLPVEHVWDALDRRAWQRVPVPPNIQQLRTALKRNGTTFHRPQSTTWSTLCEGDVVWCVRQMVITPDTDWFSDPCPYLFFKRYLWPDAYLYSQSCEIHRLRPNLFISIDWFPYMNCNWVKSFKLFHVVLKNVYRV